MPQLRTPQERATLAEAFAKRFKLVEYKHQLYMPVDFMTGRSLPATPDTTVWIPLTDRRIREYSNSVMDILFQNPAEEASHKHMLMQFSQYVPSETSFGTLVRMGESHVSLLDETGSLVPITGDFVPNYLNVPYDSHTLLAEELFKIISNWVNGDEQAHSLLYHIATALQTQWSAVKYVLLIGEGRNGKGTLLKMIRKLFGNDNISKITRQDMAAKSPIIADLNGKLLNLVFDGPKEFLKDSSNEKTLVAGEPISLRPLYANSPIEVETNALFMEALNTEPNVSDKSPALQKRLARFNFPNVYEDDEAFLERMLSPEMVAALLHLLLGHWVNKTEKAEKLRLTAESLDMQLQAVWSVSPLLRFLEWMSTRTPKFLQDILDKKMPTEDFISHYRTWLENNGYRNMEDDYVLRQLKDYFIMDRKTFRVDGRPTTKRYIKSVTPDALNAINLLLQGQSLEGASAEDLQVLHELE